MGDHSQNIGANFRGAFGRFLAGLGKQMITLGIGAKAFQKLIKNINNPAAAVAAIAAGAALVVIGNAITAKAAAGPGGGEGGGGAASGGAGGSDYAQRATVNASTQSEQRLVIQVVAKGKDLVGVYDSAKQDNQILKGGG